MLTSISDLIKSSEMPVDLERFKRAAGSWVSGLTVVTSANGDRRHGMTASAFSSVSAEPPQVLVCCDRGSATHALIRESGAFTISILAQGQAELSELFADKERGAVRFAGLDCATGVTGCPRIPGALAHIDCSVAQVHEAGTHAVYIGLVEAADIHDQEPLVFYRGTHRRLD
jgi:flavin reductase (DIM6/NTAB) family NADH-FMN oxidoreductase RutF